MDGRGTVDVTDTGTGSSVALRSLLIGEITGDNGS